MKNEGLSEFARRVLFGTSLDEKLNGYSSNFNVNNRDQAKRLDPIEIPKFPGRPVHLSVPGKSEFPSLHRLHEDAERAKVLHFFANHELLALELMALSILRFPDAPSAFKLGLSRIMMEEQTHLKLYLARMKDLGMEFGDLPVNDYFWNVMRSMQSPMDFTVQMSLTFEQANLDFSLSYMRLIQNAGDEITAKLLERVFLEEIGHVKHGLVWFNRWRTDQQYDNETDWDAYRRLLQFPLTPQRGKGFEFCADARSKAGFSEIFIREMEVYSGSKGRPPVVWSYNPHCDSEILRGKPGFTATAGAQALSEDLEATPTFLCQEHDLILVKTRPSIDWITSLKQLQLGLPEFVEIQGRSFSECVRAPKVSGLQPWGWSPEAFSNFSPLVDRLVGASRGNASFCRESLKKTFSETGFAQLFSKEWSVLFLSQWISENTLPEFGASDLVGRVFKDWRGVFARCEEILSSGYFVMLKAPFGTSGMQIRRLRTLSELDGPVGGWVKNVLLQQKSLIVEHYLNRVLDISVQMDIGETQVEVYEARPFMTGQQNEYRGAHLGAGFPDCVGDPGEYIRFFHSVRKPWRQFLRQLAEQLQKLGYQGPAGVDAFLWKDQNGKLFLKPLVELNPRWTMGRVALELEKFLAPGIKGLWAFVLLREVKRQGYESFQEYSKALQDRYPLVCRDAGSKKRIESGVFFTNDPHAAKSLLTFIVALPNPDFVWS